MGNGFNFNYQLPITHYHLPITTSPNYQLPPTNYRLPPITHYPLPLPIRNNPDSVKNQGYFLWEAILFQYLGDADVVFGTVGVIS